MLRRDIFNLLFNKTPVEEPIVPLPSPVLRTPDYLQHDHTLVYDQQWRAPLIPVELPMEYAASYAFTITLELAAKEVIFTISEENIGLRGGQLFINELVDPRAIDPVKLQGKISLVLTVNPQPKGASYVKLIALNQLGLTLATIKTTKYTTQAWVAPLRSFSPLSAIRIEGRQILKPQHT